MPQVFDTQNPAKHAFEVSDQWVTIMSQKEPGRYQVKSAPKIVSIPKKKVVVVGKRIKNDKGNTMFIEDDRYGEKDIVISTKKDLPLNPIKVDAPSKKRPIKVSAPSKKRN